ncbi:cytochrome P450 [Pterulicium gracile]|uniref:Cytochrome P450 n=1 Tax=Pterulicium gracile TaxID=1884261 RepID=A0A5C3QE75_9AGAR|nr:cytochrome P450 [Pterula gracilis]
MHPLMGFLIASIVALSKSVFYVVVFLSIYLSIRFIHRNATSPLQRLKGPRDSGFLLGHVMAVREIDAQTNKSMNGEWMKEYGHVSSFSAPLGIRASCHYLGNQFLKPHGIVIRKPGFGRRLLGRALGEGVLMAGEDVHKHQRKIMNPAFDPAQIRELFPIFMEKAVMLRDVWSQKLLQERGNARIDILSGAGKVTLDVIGAAGFDYELDALDESKKNDLTDAFGTLLGAEQPDALLLLLVFAMVIPRSWPTAWRAKRMMNRIGKQLLERSKQQASEEKPALTSNTISRPRDLLSLLVRANMDPSVPEQQRLSKDEVIAQIPTFLLAGHETTSTAIAFCLFSLAERPDIQHKLRKELLSSINDNPSMDELNTLPYLDQVLRETLRLHAPVPATQRHVMQDDLIPVSKPFTDKYGEAHNAIRVSAGESVLIPMLAINTAKEILGDDALEFKPERWLDLPKGATEIPGLLNTLTFLGGPRACIGYRFSMVEFVFLSLTN